MEKHGYITSEEADLADAIPMEQLTNATSSLLAQKKQIGDIGNT